MATEPAGSQSIISLVFYALFRLFLFLFPDYWELVGKITEQVFFLFFFPLLPYFYPWGWFLGTHNVSIISLVISVVDKCLTYIHKWVIGGVLGSFLFEILSLSFLLR